MIHNNRLDQAFHTIEGNRFTPASMILMNQEANSEPPSLPLLSDVLDYLDELAPLALAEDWDNVGLLIGRRDRTVQRVMCCLTLSERPVDEAIQSQVDLVITHHPLPFRPLSSIVGDRVPGSLILALIEAGIAVYSPHTAWDNCRGGINEQLGQMLKLENMIPINAARAESLRNQGLGAGRVGDLTNATSIRTIVERLQSSLSGMIVTSNTVDSDRCQRIGLVCGSGGSFVSEAAKQGVDLLVTGEATYHQFHEATAAGIHLLTIGHHASERFAMDRLATFVAQRFPAIEAWSSRREEDSMRLLSPTTHKASYLVGDPF